MSILIVTCLFPDEAQAFAAAEAAVEAGLAACCQVGAPVRSVYRWQGKLERAEEVPLICKTTEAAWPRLEALLKKRHPYETPEIIAVPVTHGLPAYLAWIGENTVSADEAADRNKAD